MGRVWSVDDLIDNGAMSWYANLTSISESPLQEGLIYVGTDDGMIQVTEDGGANWRRVDKFDKVPDMTYVNDIRASLFDENVAYAAFNNHKKGDFKPYVARSDNRGKTWKLISGDLPGRGSVYAVVQDHVQPDLLFVGTEFGVFFTVDGGAKWRQLKSGIPTISVRDIEIQRRENDLVAATFGRSFYILDDYTPLRELSEQMLEEEARIFPVKKAWMYIEARPMAGDDKAYQGAGFFTAPNPPFGATFTYYLKDALETREDLRRKAESDLQKEGKDTPYPAWEDLKGEDREEAPAVSLTVRDERGDVVRRIAGKTSAGIHRATWDFRYPGFRPTDLEDDGYGPLALPGIYNVSLEKRIDGVTTRLAGPVEFEVAPLGEPSLPPADRAAVLAFARETGELQRAVMGAEKAAGEAANRIKYIKAAVVNTPGLDPALLAEVRRLELRLTDLREVLTGDPTRSKRSEPAMPGITDRVNQIVYGFWGTTSAATTTHRRNYEIASELIATGKVNPTQLVTHRFALEQTPEAFETALDKKSGSVKVLVNI